MLGMIFLSPIDHFAQPASGALKHLERLCNQECVQMLALGILSKVHFYQSQYKAQPHNQF